MKNERNNKEKFKFAYFLRDTILSCNAPGRRKVQFHSPEKFSLLSCYAIRRNNLFAETAKLFLDSMPMDIGQSCRYEILSLHGSSFLVTRWQIESQFTYFLRDTGEKKKSIPSSEKFQTLIAFCDRWKSKFSPEAVKLFMDSKESIVILLCKWASVGSSLNAGNSSKQNLELNCWVLTKWNLDLNFYSWLR